MFDDQKLAELARERERNAVVTSGRAASSVGHVKQSLMLKMDKFTTVKTDDVPERNVVVKKLEVADSVEKMRAEAERKKREEENRKRLEAIQRMYTKNQNDDKVDPKIQKGFDDFVEETRKEAIHIMKVEIPKKMIEMDTMAQACNSKKQ
ncbi:hypothetical protein WA171_001194 [Blastocystis sp. BT1]